MTLRWLALVTGLMLGVLAPNVAVASPNFVFILVDEELRPGGGEVITPMGRSVQIISLP